MKVFLNVFTFATGACTVTYTFEELDQLRGNGFKVQGH